MADIKDVLRQAKEEMRDHPEQTDLILCWVFACGIGNAMRAMDHWPKRGSEHDTRKSFD